MIRENAQSISSMFIAKGEVRELRVYWVRGDLVPVPGSSQIVGWPMTRRTRDMFFVSSIVTHNDNVSAESVDVNNII